MPSRKYQQGYIFRTKNKKTGQRRTLLVSKKTGFKDVWIDGQHFYYDEEEEHETYKTIDFRKAFSTDKRTTTKKATIVVRKK